MRENKHIKKILLIGGILLIAGAIWFFVFRSWGTYRYSAGSEDPAIIMAARWVEYIEDGKIEQAKALSVANPETIIEPYCKALKEIGKVSSREIAQRNFFPGPTGTRTHQVTFNLAMPEKRRYISERIFITEGVDKKLQVVGSRFIVPLSTPYQDGETYTPDLSTPENPISMTINWFNDFDNGKLDQCAKFRGVRGAFNGGMFFFQEQSLGGDPQTIKWLTEMLKAGRPVKRETVTRMIWHGLPAMPMVDIIMIRTNAEYIRGKRQETIWLFKDNFIPNRGWHIYHVAFGKLEPVKAKNTPDVNEKNKKPAQPGVNEKNPKPNIPIPNKTT